MQLQDCEIVESNASASRVADGRALRLRTEKQARAEAARLYRDIAAGRIPPATARLLTNQMKVLLGAMHAERELRLDELEKQVAQLMAAREREKAARQREDASWTAPPPPSPPESQR